MTKKRKSVDKEKRKIIAKIQFVWRKKLSSASQFSSTLLDRLQAFFSANLIIEKKLCNRYETETGSLFLQTFSSKIIVNQVTFPTRDGQPKAN